MKKSLFWVGLISLLTSSCISFKPEAFDFAEPAAYRQHEKVSGISYHIHEIHPDTADALFDYEDLRGEGIAPFVFQLKNESEETLMFEASQIAGMVTNEEVYKKTRPSPWIYLISEVFGGTIISYLGASSPVVVGAVSAATVGHIAYMLGTNAKRKKHLNNKAPLVARIPQNVTADIFFFMDTLPMENAYLHVIGEQSKREYQFPIPSQRRFDARFIYINAAKAIRVEEGQTWQQIAKTYDLTEDEIYEYNEVVPPRFPTLQAGDTVYVSKKRGKAEVANHIVQPGETMRQIAHLYAIRLKDLHKMNRMLIGQEPAVGEAIYLRKKRKNPPALRIREKGPEGGR